MSLTMSSIMSSIMSSMSFDDKHVLIAHDRRKDLMNLISTNTSIQIVELALVLAERSYLK